MEMRKKSGPLSHKWVTLDLISPFFIEAIFFTEDNQFYDHPGLSWRKIKSSYRINKRAKKIVHGGSTITQQVAKNLFLTPKKSYFRKFNEALIALLLEYALTKERILEIYLNIIELGPGIFGVETAANYWFQCSAKDLPPKEAINLAFVTSDPLQRNPQFPSPYFENMCNYVLTILASKEMISHEEMIASLYISPH